MCDCYETMCEGCCAKIAVHIGDFSQARGNVRVWCPKCHDKFLAYIVKRIYVRVSYTFAIAVMDSSQCEGAKPGDKVIFDVTVPHGIHLN